MANCDSDFVPDSDTTSTLSDDSSFLFMLEKDFMFGQSDSTTDNNSSIDDSSVADSSIDDSSIDDSSVDDRSITNDEYAELVITTYDMMDQYIYENIISMSSPHFYTKMIGHITEILYTDMCCSSTLDIQCSQCNSCDCICDGEYNSVNDEVKEFIEQTLDIWKDIVQIPHRSTTSHTNDIVMKTPNEMTIMTNLIDALQTIEQPAQKTREWYNFRYQLITASNLWKVFGTQSQINSLIYEKCKPIDLDLHVSHNVYTEGPMHWGVKYEPVTVMLYEHIYNTRVGEFGCIPHPRYSYIGASPDGINIDIQSNRYGRMLEIKNIVNREITGIPKEEYWIQTQIQMETCDLDECDFVETRIKEYENEEVFYGDNTREYRGVMLQFIERPPLLITEDTQLANKPYYVYMPITNSLDKQSVMAWITEQRNVMLTENKVLFSQKYWFLDEISCVLIQRNREWFAAAVPLIQDVWNTILKERVDGYEHRASKKRQVKDRSMSNLSDDGTRKPNEAFCFIRLDENGDVYHH
jgi:putative phage-type endonuclease